MLSHVRLFAPPWTVAPQAPVSMGILQARILGRVAMLYFRGSFQPRDRTQVSPKNTGVGVPSLLQGILQPAIDPGSPESQADSLPAELPGKPFVSPIQFCILNSSRNFSSMFTICSRWSLLCFFLCDFIFFVYAYLCVCVCVCVCVCLFCLVFWKAWIAS